MAEAIDIRELKYTNRTEEWICNKLSYRNESGNSRATTPNRFPADRSA